MTTEVLDVVSGLRWPKWALIVFGILSVGAGVLALVWPGVTILALVILLGIDILIWGIMLMVNAFDTGQGRVLAVILGVLSLIAGAALFLQPLRNVSAVVIAVMAGVWMIMIGLIRIFAAFSRPPVTTPTGPTAA